MEKVLVVGSHGGVGSQCVKILRHNDYQVRELTSKDLDLNFPEKIFNQDFQDIDVLINCAGHNRGTYRGFLQNDWQNQLSQIMVNYASNLFLLKHYANSRKHGKYVWISSALIDNPTPFQSVYGSTKSASKFAIDLIRQEATHIDILEVKIGLVRTNFRYNNFEGTQSHEQINIAYNQANALSPEYVAQQIYSAINTNQKEIYIQ
jgi:short-subunit dehydrogenase